MILCTSLYKYTALYGDGDIVWHYSKGNKINREKGRKKKISCRSKITKSDFFPSSLYEAGFARLQGMKSADKNKSSYQKKFCDFPDGQERQI